MPLLADRTAHESTATGAISHTCGITSAVGQQASPLLRHNFVYSCGIIRVTHCRLGSRGRGHREAQRAEAGPRPSTRIAPSRTPHTDPDPPYQSTPAATTSAPHPQPRRTPGPRPRSTAQPRTRTPAPTMDETGASPAPSSPAGPTPRSTKTAPTEPPASMAGSGTTTTNEDTQPSATSPRSPASTSEPTFSGLTASCRRRRIVLQIV